MMPAIGFVGLGDIGRPMAQRLCRAGFQVFSCANRSWEAIEALKEDGLIECASPREVAQNAEILFSIVVDEKQTDTVLHGETGALAGLKSGTVLVVMSTLSPGYCIDLAQKAAVCGVTMLDCPVSGGSMGAEKGTLALMVGGDPEATERCRVALEVFGSIKFCGSVGMGQVVKLANNAVLFATISIVGEAVSMARSYGMETGRLMEMMNAASSQSFVTGNWEYVTENWAHIRDLGRKDVELCIDAARANAIALPLVETRFARDWTPVPGEPERDY